MVFYSCSSIYGSWTDTGESTTKGAGIRRDAMVLPVSHFNPPPSPSPFSSASPQISILDLQSYLVTLDGDQPHISFVVSAP